MFGGGEGSGFAGHCFPAVCGRVNCVCFVLPVTLSSYPVEYVPGRVMMLASGECFNRLAACVQLSGLGLETTATYRNTHIWGAPPSLSLGPTQN